MWSRRIALLALLALAGIAALHSQNQFDFEVLVAAFRGLEAWAPAVFIAGFTVATVLFVPGSVFGLAGGALFGPAWGTVLNLAGATLGATFAFLAARYLASDWVARRTAGRLKQLIEGVEAEGWRFVAFTRLVPLVPFNLLNYALGLTRIRLSHYVLASGICMLPGTAAYAWLGHAGRTAVQGDSAAVHYALLALAVLALIAFLPRLIRRVKLSDPHWISVDELKDRFRGSTPPAVIDIRGPDEFSGALGHIPQAINLPMTEFEGRLAEVTAPGRRTIVLVCKTDKRSEKAAALLRTNGIPDVMVLRGGMEAWNRHGISSQIVATAPVDRSVQ